MRRLATVLLLTLVMLVPVAHAADRAKPLAVGDRAPDFALLDQDGKPVKLSDLLSGREAVVVAFYIKADTPGWTMEFTRYRDDGKQYETLNAEVVGISVDSSASNRAWAAKLKLPFRLLSDVDPKGKVGKQYGVWDETWGFDGRATFVIDKKGIVRLADANALALDPSRALAAVRKITASR